MNRLNFSNAETVRRFLCMVMKREKNVSVKAIVALDSRMLGTELRGGRLGYTASSVYVMFESGRCLIVHATPSLFLEHRPLTPYEEMLYADACDCRDLFNRTIAFGGGIKVSPEYGPPASFSLNRGEGVYRVHLGMKGCGSIVLERPENCPGELSVRCDGALITDCVEPAR